MKKASKFTKGIRAKLWTLRVIDFAVLVVPILVYSIMALANGDIGTTKKVVITASIAIASIITILNLFAQKHKRSPIWIIIIAVYLALDNLMPLVIMLGIGSILDDFILAPAIKHYQTKLIASKTIDEREQYELNANVRQN